MPVADRIVEEGKGFQYILHGMNPERILIGAEVSVSWPARAAQGGELRPRAYRVRPADRPEPGDSASACRLLDGARGGESDGIQGGPRSTTPVIPAASRPTLRNISPAKPAQALRNGADDPRRHGLRKEFHVERYLRESLVVAGSRRSRRTLILSFIAEKALGLPKSY